MAKKRLYLVQAVLRTKFGRSYAQHRLLTASDPIEAARGCFDDLYDAQRVPGHRFPELFKVWAQRDPDTFNEEVGPLVIQDEFDEDTNTPLGAIVDVFEAEPVEVRL